MLQTFINIFDLGRIILIYVLQMTHHIQGFISKSAVHLTGLYQC